MWQNLAPMIATVAFIVSVAGVKIFNAWTRHEQEMARIRSQSGTQGNSDLIAMGELKREMAELRDMTTRYDLSFDSALQRLESRVNNLEQCRVDAADQSNLLTSH